jgi:hypothetical protein
LTLPSIERNRTVQEKIVKIRTFFALALALLAVSACIIEPGRGGRGYYGGGHERGVWRG